MNNSCSLNAHNFVKLKQWKIIICNSLLFVLYKSLKTYVQVLMCILIYICTYMYVCKIINISVNIMCWVTFINISMSNIYKNFQSNIYIIYMINITIEIEFLRQIWIL